MSSEQQEPTRWEILARERNARVILCNSPDTYVLADLAKSADRAMRLLRNHFTSTQEAMKAAEKIQRYYDLTIELHKLIEEISSQFNIKYRPPRAIKRILKASGGNGDGADRESAESQDEPDKTRLS